MFSDKQAHDGATESLKDHFTRSALEIWQTEQHCGVPASRQRAALVGIGMRPEEAHRVTSRIAGDAR